MLVLGKISDLSGVELCRPGSEVDWTFTVMRLKGELDLRLKIVQCTGVLLDLRLKCTRVELYVAETEVYCRGVLT